MGAECWLCSSCGATSDPAAETPPGCARCDAPLHVGKYGLIELLAPEQSCRIFRGRESTGPREVLVRILPEDLGPSLPAIRQALKRALAFSHPTVASSLDAGIHRNRVYVVEEFAPGEAITRANLTLRESMGVMRDVALAIEAAHNQGLLHPNLRGECVRVFRRAGKALGDSGWRASITGFVGPGEGSVRSNLRGLGAILYTVATGRPPGSASAASVNPLVDTALESIIRMAMDSEGSHQPPGAGEIAVELTRWLNGDAPSVKSSTQIVPPPRRQSFDWSRIRPEARIAIGVSLALVGMILVLTLRSGAPAAPPSPPQARTPEIASPPPPPPRVEPPKPAPPPPLPPVEPKPAPVATPAPPPEPKPKSVEPPKPPPRPPPADRSIGVVQAVHPEYGLFVKLEGGSRPVAGEELEAVHDGQVVARLALDRITAPEKRYPQGCAVCRIVSGAASAGDAVRRIAK